MDALLNRPQLGSANPNRIQRQFSFPNTTQAPVNPYLGYPLTSAFPSAAGSAAINPFLMSQLAAAAGFTSFGNMHKLPTHRSDSTLELLDSPKSDDSRK